MLRDCALRTVLRMSAPQCALPSSPQAHVGSVIHQLLEESPSERNKKFDELISSEESALRWNERHFVPLSRSDPGFEAKKLLAMRAFRKPVGSAGEREVAITSPDGALSGRIDLLITTSSGMVIADYKTGRLWEQAEEKERLKEEYRTQMHLYAFLFFCSAGSWPVGLRVIGLDGEQFSVDLDVAHARHLADEAAELIAKCADAVAAEQGLVNASLARKLGKPHPLTCRSCDMRPVCSAYKSARESRFGDWPRDYFGLVDSCRQTELGWWRINFEDGASLVKLSNVERHPAIECLEKGASIACFNVGGKRPLEQRLLTTIYVYSGESS